LSAPAGISRESALGALLAYGPWVLAVPVLSGPCACIDGLGKDLL
jgi:hypothetical protein